MINIKRKGKIQIIIMINMWKKSIAMIKQIIIFNIQSKAKRAQWMGMDSMNGIINNITGNNIKSTKDKLKWKDVTSKTALIKAIINIIKDKRTKINMTK